jgi:predicted transcriptional regulator
MSSKTLTKSIKKLSVLERYEKLKALLKVLETDSCLQIYSYLLLFGKTTPARLREITGQSKATIFRNLALLYETDVLDKMEDPSATDKRYNLYYYVKQDLLKLVKTIYNSDVDSHAREDDKSDIISRWMISVEALPLTLSQFTNQMIAYSAAVSANEDENCMALVKIISFRIGESEDLNELVKQMSELINTFEQKKNGLKRNFKTPLTRPVSLSISLTFLSPQDAIPLSDSATVSQVCGENE